MTSSFCDHPDPLMVCLQDDKEIVQAVEQELQQRQIALQALEPNADVDGDQGMDEDSPALKVCLLQPSCTLFKALRALCILNLWCFCMVWHHY